MSMSQRLEPTQGELRHPDDDATESAEERDETAESPQEDSDASEPKGNEQSSEPQTVSAEEFEALKRRMAAADRRATAAEQQVREFQDKDKTELQRATDRVSELEESLNGKDELIKTLQLQNGFLAANKYTWHDPELALKQVDMDSVEFDADGKPSKESLSKALKAVADKHPYLVKRTEADTTPSGEAGPRKSRNAEKDEKARRAEIARRFPSIRH